MTPNRLLDFWFFISLHLKNSPVHFHRSGKKVSSSFLRKSGFENGPLCHCKKPANFRSSEGSHRFWVTGSSLDTGWLLDGDIGCLDFYRISFLILSTVVHTLFSSGAQQDLLWLTPNCGVWKEGRGLAKPRGCPCCCRVRVWHMSSCDVLDPPLAGILCCTKSWFSSHCPAVVCWLDGPVWLSVFGLSKFL